VAECLYRADFTSNNLLIPVAGAYDGFNQGRQRSSLGTRSLGRDRTKFASLMSRLEVCGQLDNVGSLPIDSSTYQLCLSDDVLAHWIHCDLSGYGTAAGSEMRKMGGGFPELDGIHAVCDCWLARISDATADWAPDRLFHVKLALIVSSVIFTLFVQIGAKKWPQALRIPTTTKIAALTRCFWIVAVVASSEIRARST
jgi:hypothetical protein